MPRSSTVTAFRCCFALLAVVCNAASSRWLFVLSLESTVYGRSFCSDRFYFGIGIDRSWPDFLLVVLAVSGKASRANNQRRMTVS